MLQNTLAQNWFWVNVQNTREYAINDAGINKENRCVKKTLNIRFYTNDVLSVTKHTNYYQQHINSWMRQHSEH